MRTWIPTVRLVMAEQTTGEEVPIGQTTAPDLVAAVSDRLLAEANEAVEQARAVPDATVATLLELDAERLDSAIRRLIRAPVPALVPVPRDER